MSKDIIKVGQRYKLTNLRLVIWDRGEAQRAMESDGNPRAADLRNDEVVIGTWNPVNSFSEYILVAKLKEE